MDRRDALRVLATAGLGTATWPFWVTSLAERAIAAGVSQVQDQVGWRPLVLSSHQNETVVALSELIIPETDTPGAGAALVNRFIDTVLSAADEAERESFISGLSWRDARSDELFGATFVDATLDEQVALLTILSSPDNTSLADQPGIAFFAAIKSLTVTGYYTSEIGMREELGDDGTVRFEAAPGCAHPEHRG